MKILTVIDLSSASPAVMAASERVARSSNGETWILHVAAPDPEFVGYDAGPDVVREQVATELRQEHRELQAIADEYRSTGLPATALQVQGPTIATILKEAERLGVDLIITGSHGRSALYDVIAGSVSMGILRKAKCPVLVVPTREMK
jgi:nucleotide-binding universal stress UspA family protein